MYRYFVFYKHNRDAIIVDGLHLLWLCQDFAKKGIKTAVNQNGTAGQPMVLSNASQWLWCINEYKNKVQAGDIHLNFAGRLIKGNRSCYISDDGPVWRKGVRPTVNSNTKHPAYHSANSIASQKSHDNWMDTQVNGDPSYQKFAQRILQPSKIFSKTDNEKWLEEVHQQSWDSLQYNPMICNAIKSIMAHRKIALTTQNGKFNRHYSRMQHMLPVMIGAMFLAEPVRNIRAWPINLMLLDLASAGQRVRMHGSSITWKDILWHPQALEVSRANPETKDNPVVGDVSGPRSGKDRSMVQIPTIGKLHLVGGLMPASPTGGGKFGKSTIPGNKTPTSWGGFDFIHQKEIDVLLSWLKLKFPRSGRMTTANMQACGLDPSNCVRFNDLRNPAGAADIATRNLLVQIRAGIDNRINNIA